MSPVEQDTPPSVVTLTPSRGLIHSRTIAAVLAAHTYAASTGIRLCGWHFTHDLPIPASHETLAELGVASGADYLWFVEEDMVVPPDALVTLIETQRETDADVVFMDYPVGEHPTSNTIRRQPDGSILAGALGCTLMRRPFLAALPRPWFEIHDYLLTRETGGWIRLTQTTTQATYGGQDVAFCQKALAHGARLAAVAYTYASAGHARLRATGEPQRNQGAHTIDVLTNIERWDW